jgi:hypothetical protein
MISFLFILTLFVCQRQMNFFFSSTDQIVAASAMYETSGDGGSGGGLR